VDRVLNDIEGILFISDVAVRQPVGAVLIFGYALDKKLLKLPAASHVNMTLLWARAGNHQLQLTYGSKTCESFKKFDSAKKNL
jgi:hypothetical protein